MRRRRRILNYALAGLLLLVPVAILRANARAPQHLSRFDEAVLRVSSPLQAAVTWVIEGCGAIWNRYIWLVDVEQENRALRQDNSRLREELAAARRRVVHAVGLERMVELRLEKQYDMVGARVIGASMSPYFRVLRIRIDRGAEDQLTPGMPVIHGDGLVGRVHHPYGRYADVLLATDPQSSIAVMTANTKRHGVLRGLGQMDRYRCEIDHIQGKDVHEGELVVTSGLGSVFPPGLAVGRVAKVSAVEYGLFQKVEVEPFVEFSNLRTVLVVLAPPPPPDPQEGKDKPAEPAFLVRPY